MNSLLSPAAMFLLYLTISALLPSFTAIAQPKVEYVINDEAKQSMPSRLEVAATVEKLSLYFNGNTTDPQYHHDGTETLGSPNLPPLPDTSKKDGPLVAIFYLHSKHAKLRGHALRITVDASIYDISFAAPAGPSSSGVPSGAASGTAADCYQLRSGEPLTASDWVSSVYGKDMGTPWGLQTDGGPTRYKGPNYVHIFLDETGNQILATIPQGVSSMQYVVHIVYLMIDGQPLKKRFYGQQTAGAYSGDLRFNNVGVDRSALTAGSNNPVRTSSTNCIDVFWAEEECLLSTSTSDIEFKVLMIHADSSKEVTLTTQKILMTPVYHGTVDFGVMHSGLSNPEFKFVEDAANAGNGAVHMRNDGERRIVTAMLTFYTSPIVLFQHYILCLDKPEFQLHGRNDLNDHEYLERFYPSIGLSVNGSVLENIFAGFNFNAAKGLFVFGGIHYGQINAFNDMKATDGADFAYNKTVISEDEFERRSEKRWRSSWAIGISLDAKLIADLF